MTTENTDKHSRNSVLREIILEHLLIGQLLQYLWGEGITDAEILRSEFDAGGYDLVLSWGKITRHIQLKSMRVGGKAAKVSVGTRLADRPSGCVIWMVVNDDLGFDHFLWFGGNPDEPLPDIKENKITLHSKGNAQGVKLEKPAHRDVPRSAFTRVDNLADLCTYLLGPLDGPPAESQQNHPPASN